jgi:GH18 family chitinase
MNGFNGSDGQKLSDASGLVADGACEYISIMVHDVAGNYQADTGINAPLDDGSAPERQKYSIKKAIDYWVNTAKVPAEKARFHFCS